LESLLAQAPDGVVIATPSALHADQSIRALEAGAAVFCQKPVGRNAEETRRVVDAARAADRLLGVDLSYRFTGGMTEVRRSVRSGELGQVFAADLVFHNAYGPDKPWFYDRSLSGGGCVIDLGVHLVDLALWVLDFPKSTSVCATLKTGGRPLAAGEVEDYAVANIELDNGVVMRLACSWRLAAGAPAVISATFYGADAGVEFKNVGGSFYDFAAARLKGVTREVLADSPEDWSGRAAADWATRLAAGEGFSMEAGRLVDVAEVLDRIYLTSG
jgi:predicted dehydrogenase